MRQRAARPEEARGALNFAAAHWLIPLQMRDAGEVGFFLVHPHGIAYKGGVVGW
jgi:hypothetical protein